MFSTYLLRIWLVASSYRYVTWVIREVTCILHYMDVWLSWKRWHVPCMGISLFLHIDRNFGTRVPNKLGSVSHNITVMAPGYLEKGLCQARFGTQVKLGNLTRTSPPLIPCSPVRFDSLWVLCGWQWERNGEGITWPINRQIIQYLRIIDALFLQHKGEVSKSKCHIPVKGPEPTLPGRWWTKRTGMKITCQIL
jgi:hypothetical protein